MVEGENRKVDGRGFNDLGFRIANLEFLKGLFSDINLHRYLYFA